MAVGNVEIAVGQVWRTHEGYETIPLRQSDDKTYPFWDDRMMATWGADGRCFAGKMDASDLIELVRDEHGFTPWAGGESPVDQHAMVVVRFDNGYTQSRPQMASDLRWGANPGDNYHRIVAYKLADTSAKTLANDIMVKTLLTDEITQALEKPDSASLAEETLSALGWVFDGTTWVEQPKASLPEWDGVSRFEFIDTSDVTPNNMAVPGYELLADVLHRAFNQAAIGKGKERHANGEPFDEQVMQDGARRFGVGALLFQAFKKSEESQRLPLERGVNELLGAIVYLAGAVIRREADASEGGAA